MIRAILKIFGWRIVYVSDWGEKDSRYDSIDRAMCRPLHRDMGCAPPWAKMKLRRIEEKAHVDPA